MKVVTAATYGLSREGGQSPNPAPVATGGQPAEIILSKGWNVFFAFVAALSWTFLFRVAS